MKKTTLMAALMVAIPTMANAGESRTDTDNFTDNWPTHHVLDDGTDLGLTLKYQYAVDRFPHDDSRLAATHPHRRQALGFYVQKKGVYDATVA